MDKDTFTNSNDFDIKAVSIKSGVVHVRTMLNDDAETHERVAAERSEKKDYRGFRAELLRLTLCTEQGEFLFKDIECAEALAIISGKSRLTVEALFDAAQEVNGYDATVAEDDAKN